LSIVFIFSKIYKKNFLVLFYVSFNYQDFGVKTIFKIINKGIKNTIYNIISNILSLSKANIFEINEILNINIIKILTIPIQKIYDIFFEANDKRNVITKNIG